MLPSSSNIYPLVPRNILFERNGLYISLYKGLGPSLPSFRLHRHFPRKRTNTATLLYTDILIFIFPLLSSTSISPSSPFLFRFINISRAQGKHASSFDSISILSVLSFSPSSLSLIHQSRSILFPLFYFATKDFRVEHVYLRECILSRFEGRIRVTYTKHGSIACALFVSFALLFRF